MELFEQVKEVIVDTLNCTPEEVTPEARLAEDLGADSLDAVELNMALEDETGLAIPDGEMEKMKTVKDIVDYLEAHAG